MSSTTSFLFDCCKNLIHDLWVESSYNFDKTRADQKVLQIFAQHELEQDKVYITNPKELLIYIAGYYNVPITQIHEKNRERDSVGVRQVYSYLAKCIYFPTIPLSTLAHEIRDGYNHASVMHGIKTIRNEMGIDKRLRRDLSILINTIELK